MSKELPRFSARAINRVEDYVRLFHTKAYLRQRSAVFPSPASDPALMAACGYRKQPKLIRHRTEWDDLRRRVPLAYLRAIGVDLDVLVLTTEVDMEEFRAVLTVPLFPRYGTERLVPGFYGQLVFPPRASESEALSILRAHSRKTGHECCVNFPAIKAVFVRPNGSVSTILFPPKLSIANGFLVPGGDGGAIGTCLIGR